MANKISIAGIVETEETHVMGFARNISTDAIKSTYQEDSKKLEKLLQGVNEVKSHISIIKGISEDFKSMQVVFGAIVELSGEANNILTEDKGVWAVIPPHPTVLKVVLNGSKDHLKEAWNKAFTFIKDNKLIVDMYANAWEVYASSEENNLITEIYIPLIITKDKDLEKLSI
ncbi:MAG: GyrI-like domain-containing protein [Alphaproteobacteria bacterium]|jgi:effector-binding domain-containing protein|nr:GyrI-like domain-containing protein [Alphaproteobacteria bacterium]